MTLTIKTEKNTDAGKIALPAQFSEPLREDLIIRAVLALQANRRQPYGGYGDAGMRHSADLSKRRRKYRGTYGSGRSRVPRKVLSRRGTQMYQVGAIVAGTVGGRRAHGPKPFKIWTQKVNQKENRKAIRSAMAATVDKDIIAWRGHQIPEGFPFILDDAFEKIAKTKDLEDALVHLGFAAELERGAIVRIRAGKGTMRNRKTKNPVSFLFVVSGDVPLMKAAANIPGTDVVPVESLNAELLAPGTHPGRLTLYTQSAITRLEKEGMFLKTHKGPSTVKITKAETKKSEKKVAKPETKKAVPKASKPVAKPVKLAAETKKTAKAPKITKTPEKTPEVKS